MEEEPVHKALRASLSSAAKRVIELDRSRLLDVLLRRVAGAINFGPIAAHHGLFGKRQVRIQPIKQRTAV